MSSRPVPDGDAAPLVLKHLRERLPREGHVEARCWGVTPWRAMADRFSATCTWWTSACCSVVTSDLAVRRW